MTEDTTTTRALTEDPSFIDRVIEIKEGGQTFRGRISKMWIENGRYLAIFIVELRFLEEKNLARRWRARGSKQDTYEGALGSLTLKPGLYGSIEIDAGSWRAVIMPQGTQHPE